MHVCYKMFTPLGYGVLLAKKQRLGPKLEGAWLGEHPKIWDPLRIYAAVEASNFKFGTQIGFGTSLPKKQCFGPKLVGGLGQGSIQKKCGTPYTFLQPLKPATSNLVHKLGFGLAYQNNNVLDQNWRGSGPKEHHKNLGPPTYFCNC